MAELLYYIADLLYIEEQTIFIKPVDIDDFYAKALDLLKCQLAVANRLFTAERRPSGGGIAQLELFIEHLFTSSGLLTVRVCLTDTSLWAQSQAQNHHKALLS